MKSFGEELRQRISYLIEREIKNDSLIQSIFKEILHHATHSRNLTSKMNFISNRYKIIQKYILDEKNCFPFVLTGLSGTGKSSLLAYVAKKVIHIFETTIIEANLMLSF